MIETFYEDKLTDSFQKILQLHCMSGVKHFKKVLFSYVLFHFAFITAFILEGAFLTTLYFLENTSSLFAIGIFSLILTVFSYLVLIFYFQAKKPEQFKQLKEWFLSICKKSIPEELSPSDYHLFLAQAIYTFAMQFHLKDLPVYFKNFPIPSFQRIMKKCSYLWHAQDFQKIKEILLLDCIYQHLALLKYEPTNLEVHASLGNSYLTLASVYKSMHKETLSQSEPLSLDELKEDLLKLFKNSINKAIEEYKIIRASTQQDNPWVLAQLATCYHELEMYDKEIEHFEKILDISESNQEVMTRLGFLYFQEGRNAQGFQLYKIIKETDPQKASELFDYYIMEAQKETLV
jgi:tetratricopeptide (TPR) repeat protein